jgi:hypothetical protein
LDTRTDRKKKFLLQEKVSGKFTFGVADLSFTPVIFFVAIEFPQFRTLYFLQSKPVIAHR